MDFFEICSVLRCKETVLIDLHKSSVLKIGKVELDVCGCQPQGRPIKNLQYPVGGGPRLNTCTVPQVRFAFAHLGLRLGDALGPGGLGGGPERRGVCTLGCALLNGCYHNGMRRSQAHPDTREPKATGDNIRPFQVQLVLDGQAGFPVEVLAGNRRQACELALPKWWRIKRRWQSPTVFVALRPGGGWAVATVTGKGPLRVEVTGGGSFSPASGAAPGPRRVSRFLNGVEAAPVFADCYTAAEAVAAALKPGWVATDLRHLVGDAWLFECGRFEGATARVDGDWVVTLAQGCPNAF